MNTKGDRGRENVGRKKRKNLQIERAFLTPKREF
jgi:hypothetical protein